MKVAALGLAGADLAAGATVRAAKGGDDEATLVIAGFTLVAMGATVFGTDVAGFIATGFAFGAFVTGAADAAPVPRTAAKPNARTQAVERTEG